MGRRIGVHHTDTHNYKDKLTGHFYRSMWSIWRQQAEHFRCSLHVTHSLEPSAVLLQNQQIKRWDDDTKIRIKLTVFLNLDQLSLTAKCKPYLDSGEPIIDRQTAPFKHKTEKYTGCIRQHEVSLIAEQRWTDSIQIAVYFQWTYMYSIKHWGALAAVCQLSSSGQ